MIADNNLSMAKPGCQLEVVSISDGPGKNSRLLDMGITPGTRVKVIAVHPFKGPVVVQLEGSQVAIGRRIAQNINVRSVSTRF